MLNNAKRTVDSVLPCRPDQKLTDSAALIKLIKLTIFTYKETINALKAFTDEDYALLDAQVGENLCQIRAAKLIHIINNKMELGLTSDIIGAATCKLLELISILSIELASLESSKKTLGQEKLTVSEYLNIQGFNIFLPEVYWYLCRNHVLHKYCVLDENGIPKAIDVKAISCSASIVVSAAKRLVHKFQTNISKDSTDFVLHHCKNMKIPSGKLEYLNRLRRLADEKREVFPCFEGAKILLDYLIRNQTSIYVIFKEDSNKQAGNKFGILFQANNQRCYDIVAPIQGKVNYPVIVIEGITNIFDSKKFSLKSAFERIATIGLEKLFYLNMAAHPQYTGKVLKPFRNDPYIDEKESCKIAEGLSKELKKNQVESESFGCSKNNPSFFLIKHIFCSLLEDVLCYNRKVVKFSTAEKNSKSVQLKYCASIQM